MKDPTHPYRGTKRRRDFREKHSKRADTERKIFERTHELEDKHDVLSFWVKDDNAELDYFIVEFRLLNKITLREFRKRLHKDLGDLIEENTNE